MLSLSSLSASLLFIITYEFIIIVIIISIITIVFLIILLLRSLLVSLLFLLAFLLLLLLLLLALLLSLLLLYRGESIFILFERYRLPLPIRSNLIGKSYSVSMFVYMLFYLYYFHLSFFYFLMYVLVQQPPFWSWRTYLIKVVKGKNVVF